MRRREFLNLVGITSASPLTARAQPERMRRIGVLSNAGESDPEAQSMVAALHQAKTAKALGLTVPANLLATADEVIE